VFVIKKSQFEAFRVPLRKKKREELVMSLNADGRNKVVETHSEITVENNKGRKSSLLYSDKNLLSQLTKPTGAKFQFTYDDEDRLNKIELGNEENLKIRYKGALPDNIQINDAGLDIIYNPKNQVSEIVYPDKKSVRFQYDKFDQLTSITNRSNAIQSFQTTLKDQKLVHQLKDALGRQTTLMMDSVGVAEKIVFPDGTTQEVVYEEEIDAEVVKLRNGKTKTVYSGELYPERIEWEDGKYQNIKINDLQQVEVLENETGTISYTYDEKGRPLSESFQSSEVNYVYEEEFLKSIIYPGGLEVTYDYDEDDNLKSVKIGDKLVSYDHDINGTIAQIKYPNGVIEKQKSLVFGGLQESVLSRSGELISRQTYQYNKLGCLTSINDFDSIAKDRNYTFEYDVENRLASSKEIRTKFNESFYYDLKGNIVQANTQKIDVGKMDEVKRIDGNELEYDLAGNLSGFKDDENRQLRFSFSDNGTLRAARNGNEVWKYTYDGLGRRISKSNGRETYRFFWAGDKLLTEEYSKDKTVIREYIYTDDNVPVAFREGTKLYFIQRDVRGAVIKVHDESGEIVWSAGYTAFGKAKISVEKIYQPWRLQGQYYDIESGLHYNLARYYSPYLRSYLSLDPKWLVYGATNYSYAANDPYNKFDSDGNLPKWLNTKTLLPIAVGIAVGALVVAGAMVAFPVLAAATLGSLMAAAAIGGVAGGLAETITSNLLNNKPVCEECLKNALIAGALAALLVPLLMAVGGVLAPAAVIAGGVLAPVARRLLPKVVNLIPKRTAARALKVSTQSLQHTFSKHAKDFGVTGKWDKAMASNFEGVIKNHMKGLTPIQGTYRGTQKALHYYNPKTGLNVMTDMNGNLIGGWKLSTDQIKYLLTNGAVK